MDRFQSATAFNGDISAWDTSSVTAMYGVFVLHSRCFRVTAALITFCRFNTASSFNGDISAWDTSSATLIHWM